MKCIKCTIVINPLRIKALPNTRVCVDCSTLGAYKAVSTTHGEGDNTWNDIQVMTPKQYSHYSKQNHSSFDSEEDL
tara:strand:+ start:955 stop:1182 length:228 start_codon:yes stop_codon:yes gene_type:complete